MVNTQQRFALENRGTVCYNIVIENAACGVELVRPQDVRFQTVF
jgi:hypothetical protein